MPNASVNHLYYDALKHFNLIASDKSRQISNKFSRYSTVPLISTKLVVVPHKQFFSNIGIGKPVKKIPC